MSKKKKNKKRPGKIKKTAKDAVDESEKAAVKTGSKVIDRGDSKLIVTGGGKTGKADGEQREITVRPRILKSADDDTAEVAVAEETNEVVRLESANKPGEDRVKIEKAKFDKLSELLSKAESEEARWGEKITIGWWVTIAGACAVVILVGGLLLKYFSDRDTEEVLKTELIPLELQSDPYEGRADRWLHENLSENKKKAMSLIERYISSGTLQARSALVRDPAKFLKHVDSWPYKFSPRAVDDENCKWSVLETKDTAYMLLKGLDADFMPMHAYFVRDGDSADLKLDWHATVGWSDVPMNRIKGKLIERQAQIEKLNLDYKLAVRRAIQAQTEYEKKQAEYQRQTDLRKKGVIQYVVKDGDTLSKIAALHRIDQETLKASNNLGGSMIKSGQILKISTRPSESELTPPEKPLAVDSIPNLKLPPELYTEPVTMRCLLTRRNEHYLGPYNEKDHSAFLLRSPDRLTYMWGYVERDSQLDQDLRRILDHGRFVVKLRKDYPVIVRVKRSGKDALPSQLELVELVHPDWVTP